MGRVAKSVMAVWLGAAIGTGCLWAQTAAVRNEVTVNAPRAAVSAAPNLAAVIRPIMAASFSLPRTISVSPASGSSGVVRTSQQDLYYSGAVPVEFFEPASFQPHEDTKQFGLNLHLPGVRSLISMGGGEVGVSSTSMMGMARSAGIAEARLDIASMGGRFTLRVQGRAVCTRSDTFVTPLFSTENWVVTERPSINATYHF